MKNKTVQAKIAELLNHDPMCLMFIMDAISKNVDNVLRDEQQTIDALKNSFVNGEAWVDAAKRVKQELWPTL